MSAAPSSRRKPRRESGSNPPQGAEALDVAAIRRDFPIFEKPVRGKPLVFLDSAASAQKPRQVIDALSEFYRGRYANVHRGVYWLSSEATRLYDEARERVARFVGAADSREIVFVRNATEAINLVAHTFADTHLEAGDEILISAMEHHANIVPWQMLCQRIGTRLRVAPITRRGELDLDALHASIGERTKLVALTQVSNALGTINPIAEIAPLLAERDIRLLVDGAQAVPHMRVDVRELGCDFYAFSGHKLFGPTGIGVLYGRLPLLEASPPFLGGGDMIETVSFEHTTYAPPPQRFEAGTPDIAGAVGLAAAIDYVEGIGLERIERSERALLAYATAELEAVDGLELIGTAPHKAGVLSFVLEGVHPHDVGTILDQAGVSVRAGHHCAQPLMDFYGVPATVRASLALYNTREDVDCLIAGLREVRELFS